MNSKFPSVTVLETRCDHLEKIDMNQIDQENPHKWYTETLTQVNDSVVRLGIIEGEYHWHEHIDEDEFFFVLEGQLFIDIEDRTIELNPNQGKMIIKGLKYRTLAPKKIMLMVETNNIIPTGSTQLS
jgi:mannose-6-phosphate isomerase-like protein (cupin superfamily)